MNVINCEYDEKKKHKNCKNFPCILCNIENEKKVLKKILNEIKKGGDIM